MKKLLVLLFAGLLILGLSGCSNTSTSTSSTNTESASVLGNWEFEGLNEIGDYVTVTFNFADENSYTLDYSNTGTDNNTDQEVSTTVNGEYIISDQAIELSITSVSGDESLLNSDFTESKSAELEYDIEDSDTLVILDMGNVLSELDQQIALTR